MRKTRLPAESHADREFFFGVILVFIGVDSTSMMTQSSCDLCARDMPIASKRSQVLTHVPSVGNKLAQHICHQIT